MRSTTALRALVLAAAVTLLAGACAPPPDGGPTTTTTAPTTWTAGPCPTATGVTVIVDFAGLGPAPVVRCALGPQPSGLAALANAGFATSSESGAGTVCTVDGLPSQGFPYCWLTGGYWSYWRAPAKGAPWAFAETGPGAGPLVQGSVEGWAWAPGFASDGPSVSSAGG